MKPVFANSMNGSSARREICSRDFWNRSPGTGWRPCMVNAQLNMRNNRRMRPGMAWRFSKRSKFLGFTCSCSSGSNAFLERASRQLKAERAGHVIGRSHVDNASPEKFVHTHAAENDRDNKQKRLKWR